MRALCVTCQSAMRPLDRSGASCSDRRGPWHWPINGCKSSISDRRQHRNRLLHPSGRMSMKSTSAKTLSVRASVAAALTLVCLPLVTSAQGVLGQRKGEGGTEVQGSAGPGGSQGDNGLEHCDKPM